MSGLSVLREMITNGGHVFSSVASHNNLWGDLKKANELLRNVNGDKFHSVAEQIAKETGLIVKEGTELGKLSYLGRLKIYVQHTFNQLFSRLVYIVKDGKTLVEKTFDDIIRTAKRLVPANAAAIRQTAGHLDELKGLLGDNEAVVKLVQARLKNSKLGVSSSDVAKTKLLDTLMSHCNSYNATEALVLTLKLPHAERQVLLRDIRNRERELIAIMTKEASAGKYTIMEGVHGVKPSEAAIKTQAEQLARVQVLSEGNHFGPMIEKNKTLKDAVDKAMGIKPAVFKKMTHEAFNELDAAGQAFILKEFKANKQKIVDGLLANGRLAKEIQASASGETLALTGEQAKKLALKKAQYLAESSHGIIPVRDYRNEMFAEIEKLHNQTIRKFIGEARVLKNDQTMMPATLDPIIAKLKQVGITVPKETKDTLTTGQTVKDYLNELLVQTT